MTFDRLTNSKSNIRVKRQYIKLSYLNVVPDSRKIVVQAKNVWKLNLEVLTSLAQRLTRTAGREGGCGGGGGAGGAGGGEGTVW